MPPRGNRTQKFLLGHAANSCSSVGPFPSPLSVPRKCPDLCPPNCNGGQRLLFDFPIWLVRGSASSVGAPHPPVTLLRAVHTLGSAYQPSLPSPLNGATCTAGSLHAYCRLTRYCIHPLSRRHPMSDRQGRCPIRQVLLHWTRDRTRCGGRDLARGNFLRRTFVSFRLSGPKLSTGYIAPCNNFTVMVTQCRDQRKALPSAVK